MSNSNDNLNSQMPGRSYDNSQPEKRRGKEKRPSTGNGKGTRAKRMRMPKDINAPRHPLTGYVRYLNKHRERAKEGNPNQNFTEITKVLAAEWSSLTPDKKQKYLDDAEKDKEKYLKELEAYQQTDSHRKYIKEQKDNKEGRKAAAGSGQIPIASRSSEAKKDVEMVDISPAFTSSFDIPIFTEEFLDHNRARESELRQLRKLNTEYEEQNAILSKHIENMKLATDKLELEALQQKSNNDTLYEHLSQLRKGLATHLATIAIPSTGEFPTIENIDNYMQKLHTKLIREKTPNKENDVLLDKVQNLISNIEFNFQ